jgi:anthranilate/para-aminobenzoate synthase component I
VDDSGTDRQLNIQIDQEHLVGTYANFANISFSDYEFTMTFARIDHEIQEGEIPGVVVSRVNMSAKFAKELLDAMQDSWSKYSTVKGIQDLPEAPPRPQ